MGMSEPYVKYAMNKSKQENGDNFEVAAAKMLTGSGKKMLPAYQEPLALPVIVKPETSKLQNLMFNLHGFTADGARQLIMRVLMNLDRSRPYAIKFNIGKGLHSQGGVHKLQAVLFDVCHALNFDDPEQSSVNQGHYILSLPALPSGDDPR